MNTNFRVLTLVLISVFLLILLPGCSTIGTMTPVTTADSQGEAAPPPPEPIEKTLPYAFEGLIQPGAQNAPPVEVIMGITLPQMPAEVPSYRVEPVTEEYMTNLAHKLGFNNKPSRAADGSQINFYKGWDYVPKTPMPPGAYALEIYNDGSLLMRTDINTVDVPNSLPSFEEAVTISKQWLVSHNLYPPNVTRVVEGGSPMVTGINIETKETVVKGPFLVTVKFMVSLGDVEMHRPGALVCVGENGKILRAEISSSQIKEYGAVKLKTPDSALNILKSYLSSPQADLQETKECIISMRNFELLTITSVSLQYTKTKGYLQPIYVFSGNASSQLNPNGEAFTGKVDAVLR